MILNAFFSMSERIAQFSFVTGNFAAGKLPRQILMPENFSVGNFEARNFHRVQISQSVTFAERKYLRPLFRTHKLLPRF